MRKKLILLLPLAAILFFRCSHVDDSVKKDPASAPNTITSAIGAANIAGVNWADGRDNFVDGWVIPSGLTASDNYSTVQSKADIVLAAFQDAGANTIRLPINPPSVLESWWGPYSGATDKALSRGMKVIICCWESNSSRNGLVDDLAQFWDMWQVVVNKYGGNANVYFEVFNEPHGYSLTDLNNLYADWLNHYPSVPKGRILLGGAGYCQNVIGVGSDSRFAGTLLSHHDYTWFAGDIFTPAGWENRLKNNVGSYASRTVVTEFGIPLTTGKSYTSPANGDKEIAYLQGLTSGFKNLGIASVYWPGLRDGDSYSLFTFNGSSMTLTNSSGLSRIKYGWNISDGNGSFNSSVYYRIINRNSGKAVDVNGASITSGASIIQWTYGGGNNQQWKIEYLGGGVYRLLNRNSGQAVDVNGASATNGASIIQWPWNGGTNQQWLIVNNGGGYYRILNFNSSSAMDVNGGSTANGASIIQWPWNGGNNQQWQIIQN
jgi:endoglucanase